MQTNQQSALNIKDANDEHQENHFNKITYDTYDSIYYLLYFIGRYSVVITSYFLCVIASLYAIGSLVTLEATNFFCASYTLEKIRQYNLDNGNEHGVDDDSCLRIDRQGLNSNVLSDLNYNIFTGKIDSDSLDFVAYFQAILYFTTAFVLFIPALYHTYLLIYDTIYALYSFVYHEQKNEMVKHKLTGLHKSRQRGCQAEHSQNQQKSTLKTVHRALWCCFYTRKTYSFCVRECMKCYFKHIQPIYYVDSKWRMLSIIFREWFEIAIQIYALLLYGGINIFDIESNVLSQTSDIIESFAVIVSVNCVAGVRSCIACVCYLDEVPALFLFFL